VCAPPVSGIRASARYSERSVEPARTLRAVQHAQRQQWSKDRPAACPPQEHAAAAEQAEAEGAAAAGAEDGVDEAEVERYAVHLGMDPTCDGELFWIAEQALLAPLPPQWVEVLMEGDATAFQNKLTGVVTWCVRPARAWSVAGPERDRVSRRRAVPRWRDTAAHMGPGGAKPTTDSSYGIPRDASAARWASTLVAVC
jgi:hypothetical protein